eukprot:163459-Rhodomonas_salina.2
MNLVYTDHNSHASLLEHVGGRPKSDTNFKHWCEIDTCQQYRPLYTPARIIPASTLMCPVSYLVPILLSQEEERVDGWQNRETGPVRMVTRASWRTAQRSGLSVCVLCMGDGRAAQCDCQKPQLA